MKEREVNLNKINKTIQTYVLNRTKIVKNRSFSYLPNCNIWRKKYKSRIQTFKINYQMYLWTNIVPVVSVKYFQLSNLPLRMSLWEIKQVRLLLLKYFIKDKIIGDRIDLVSHPIEGEGYLNKQNMQNARLFFRHCVTYDKHI